MRKEPDSLTPLEKVKAKSGSSVLTLHAADACNVYGGPTVTSGQWLFNTGSTSVFTAMSPPQYRHIREDSST
jgi:hypothetical protein